MTIPEAPEGFSTVNPFIITRDAEGLIAFLAQVFGGTEHPIARTVDDDGLLLHAELSVGDTTVMFAERKPDWPFMPSLLQVYVHDVEATLATAEKLGATIVTRPTPFYGDVFSRFLDPWKNLWWVYRHSGVEAWTDGEAGWGNSEAGSGDGEAAEQTDAAVGEAGWSAEATPELVYIHDTLARHDSPPASVGQVDEGLLLVACHLGPMDSTSSAIAWATRTACGL